MKTNFQFEKRQRELEKKKKKAEKALKKATSSDPGAPDSVDGDEVDSGETGALPDALPDGAAPAQQ